MAMDPVLFGALQQFFAHLKVKLESSELLFLSEIKSCNSQLLPKNEKNLSCMFLFFASLGLLEGYNAIIVRTLNHKESTFGRRDDVIAPFGKPIICTFL
jgi:hypothetical protein